MKVYFLDRNIVSIIKNSNSGISAKDKNKFELLKKLRQIDRKKSFITPMLSIMEGEKARLQAHDEVKKLLDDELSACEKFFDHAEIDYSLKELSERLISGLISKDYKESINREINFLFEINEFIFQNCKAETRKKLKIDILKTAEKYNLHKTQPVVFSSLLCLYNNEICRKILKPKQKILEKNYFYNAVMDFKYFSFFSMLTKNISYSYRSGYKSKVHFEFITGDKNLNSFFKYFCIEGSSLYSDGFSLKFRLSEEGNKILPLELQDIFLEKRSLRM